MRHFLVIGGAGYVGSALSDHLLALGDRVTVVDNFIYDHNHTVMQFLSHPRFNFVFGDIRSPDKFLDRVSGFTHVVILAGLVGDPITKKYPSLSAEINNVGVFKLIDSLAGKSIDKVIFVSTCSNYGLIPDDEVANEQFELNPLSLYAKAKVAAEEYLLSQKDHVDYAPVVLRFATAFGLSARMRFDLTVSEFARHLLLGRELEVYDADTWRPYCHVKDFSRLIGIVSEAQTSIVAGEVFNAGGDANNCTKRGIVELVQSLYECGQVTYSSNGGDPRNYRVDFSKVKHKLGFEPHHTLKDGIDELFDAITNKVFDGVDGNPRMYGNYVIGLGE